MTHYERAGSTGGLEKLSGSCGAAVRRGDGRIYGGFYTASSGLRGRGRQASLCGRRHGVGLNPLARLSVSFSHACTCARDSRKVPADPIMQPASCLMRKHTLGRWNRVGGRRRYFDCWEWRRVKTCSLLMVSSSQGQVGTGEGWMRQVRAGNLQTILIGVCPLTLGGER